jgi:hypothetical protein
MNKFFLSLSIFVIAVGAICADAKFVTPPSASKSSEGATISFAVAERTDVEVAVLNGNGDVVRHLAAGVLGGEKPPPEPLKAGLSQSIVWDGKDDFGKTAPGGAFKARVRAGMNVKFGRFIGDDPYSFGGFSSIAADDAGNLYIMGFGGNRNQNYRVIRVFDADGRYLREIMPFPADLPPTGMKNIAAWDPERKSFVPQNLSSLCPEFYTTNGLSLVSASSKTGVMLTDPYCLYHLDSDGGISSPGFGVQAFWSKDYMLPNTGGGPVYLATSPDGKYEYLSGPFSSKTTGGHTYNRKFPPGQIYRMKLGSSEAMQPFAAVPVRHPEVAGFEVKPGVEGGAWTSTIHNEGIAEGPIHGATVDKAGNVYVADRERQRISIFAESGQEAGKIEVAQPHQIAIHPKTGEVYVLSRLCTGYWKYSLTLSKFSSLANGLVPMAKYVFPAGSPSPQMALVASDKQTSVYCGGVPGNLVRLIDKGASFESGATLFAPQAEGMAVFNRMEVDKTRDEVYVSNGDASFWRFNGETGEGGLLKKKDGKPFAATDLAVGYDGLLYFQTGESFSGPLERYTRELAPAPYPSGTHVLSKYIYGRYGIGNCEKGIGVGADGKVFVSWMFSGWVQYAVSAWGADGKGINGKYSDIADYNTKGGTSPELKKAFIGPIPQANGGVRVDLKGNVYVGMIVGKTSIPKSFEKNDGYKHCTGSVVKFGPEGGTVPGSPDQMVGNIAEGASNTYSGLSPFSHPHLATNCCVCRVPRFDVDYYGRLAIPNATGNYAQIVDNAGNEILTFGKYGNFDSQYVNPNSKEGKENKPRIAVPEIPLAWPNSAGMTDKHVYVLDVYNRRVVRADKTFTAEAVCDLK